MSNYADQVAFVESIQLDPGGHARLDCPFCGSKNTLSISKEGGELRFFCFQASCDVRGRKRHPRSKAEILQTLTEHQKPEPAFQLPDYLTNVFSSEECVRYLTQNQCMDAYEARTADIRYDPRQHRAVFVVWHDGQPVDAVGRSLHKGVKPKWLRYGKAGHPFICGASKLGVIVEDAASACSVGRSHTGIALLGTHLQESHVTALRQFDQLVIALDPDATRKALDIHRLLSYITDTAVLRLDEEFKSLTKDQAAALVSKWEGACHEAQIYRGYLSGSG